MHLINGQPSRVANPDLLGFDSSAESAVALKPGAMRWFSELIGAPCKGEGPSALAGRIMYSDTSPGRAPGLHAPRRWRVIVAELSVEKTATKRFMK